MSSIKVECPSVPIELIGAYQCKKHDINQIPNRILLINTFSTLNDSLLMARKIQTNCLKINSEGCEQNCPISIKIEELEKLVFNDILKNLSEKLPQS